MEIKIKNRIYNTDNYRDCYDLWYIECRCNVDKLNSLTKGKLTSYIIISAQDYKKETT